MQTATREAVNSAVTKAWCVMVERWQRQEIEDAEAAFYEAVKGFAKFLAMEPDDDGR
jgi:hypothetical protein